MPQSHSQVLIHLVFSTKQRRPFLSKESFRLEMFRMLAHHVVAQGCVSISVGGYIDHVHLLFGLSRTITIAKLVERIKTETSGWASSVEQGATMFQWQNGYTAFSVSRSNTDSVDRYIRDQELHHQQMSFHDEFRLLCQKHGIELDDRYAWD